MLHTSLFVPCFNSFPNSFPSFAAVATLLSSLVNILFIMLSVHVGIKLYITANPGFPRGGDANHIILPKNCIKMKKNLAQRGACPWRPLTWIGTLLSSSVKEPHPPPIPYPLVDRLTDTIESITLPIVLVFWPRVSLCRQKELGQVRIKVTCTQNSFDLSRTKAHLSGDHDIFVGNVYKHLVFLLDQILSK